MRGSSRGSDPRARSRTGHRGGSGTHASRLANALPPGLSLQEYDGTSWVGVVPFRMQGVMRRPLPDLPWLSAFPELNLRLYVEAWGKPGVWFLSLDAVVWSPESLAPGAAT